MTDERRIADAAMSLERRVAAMVADMRGRRGMTQAALAELLGVAPERVARLESVEAGEAASLALLAGIAERLDFHVTLALHDRRPSAAAELGQTEAAPVETLAAVSLDDGIQLGDAQDIVLTDDVAITIPDDPGGSFLLDDGAAGMVSARKDDTFSPGGGDGGFSDGMGN